MKPLSFYERQHIQTLLQQQGSIKYIFDEFTREVSSLLCSWVDTDQDNVWIRNKILEKAIEKKLLELQKKLLSNLQSYGDNSWTRSDKKNEDLIKNYIKGIPISENVKKGFFTRNMKAFEAYKNNQKQLSGKVWKIAEGAKENIEYYLSSGLSTGRSAALISQDLRTLLNDSNKRFRRIRNEEGKLVYSKPMADYHPGQGVYRSSYKNALRLASTETNMAYRRADSERWKTQGFVLGVEIRRSDNNKGPCKICDAMVGVYSKEFIFSGWHPNCICYSIPIMLEGEEFTDYLLEDKIPEQKMIRDIPTSAKLLIATNPNLLQASPVYEENKKWF